MGGKVILFLPTHAQQQLGQLPMLILAVTRFDKEDQFGKCRGAGATAIRTP
jgi:hypothetical protein